MKNNKFFQNMKSGINTAVIGKQLRKHLDERARLQKKQDDLWRIIKQGYDRSYEMERIDELIGNNTYAIDSLIGQLVRAGCRSGQAYTMAVNYLKSEIARNQRIVSSWEQKIRSVQMRRSCWITSTGVKHYDCTNAYRYLAKKKSKTANTQRLLSQLLYAF